MQRLCVYAIHVTQSLSFLAENPTAVDDDGIPYKDLGVLLHPLRCCYYCIRDSSSDFHSFSVFHDASSSLSLRLHLEFILLPSSLGCIVVPCLVSGELSDVIE